MKMLNLDMGMQAGGNPGRSKRNALILLAFNVQLSCLESSTVLWARIGNQSMVIPWQFTSSEVKASASTASWVIILLCNTYLDYRIVDNEYMCSFERVPNIPRPFKKRGVITIIRSFALQWKVTQNKVVVHCWLVGLFEKVSNSDYGTLGSVGSLRFCSRFKWEHEWQGWKSRRVLVFSRSMQM